MPSQTGRLAIALMAFLGAYAPVCVADANADAANDCQESHWVVERGPLNLTIAVPDEHRSYPVYILRDCKTEVTLRNSPQGAPFYYRGTLQGSDNIGSSQVPKYVGSYQVSKQGCASQTQDGVTLHYTTLPYTPNSTDYTAAHRFTLTGVIPAIGNDCSLTTTNLKADFINDDYNPPLVHPILTPVLVLFGFIVGFFVPMGKASPNTPPPILKSVAGGIALAALGGVYAAGCLILFSVTVLMIFFGPILILMKTYRDIIRGMHYFYHYYLTKHPLEAPIRRALANDAPIDRRAFAEAMKQTATAAASETASKLRRKRADTLEEALQADTKVVRTAIEREKERGLLDALRKWKRDRGAE